jgi:hypothetical protein
MLPQSWQLLFLCSASNGYAHAPLPIAAAAAAAAAAGKRVSDVAPKLAAAVEPFGVNLVEGVMSHQMKQFVIDGNKVRYAE